LKTLALVPVPSSLTSLFGGGGAAVGTGLTLKAAAAVTAGLAIGGGGYEGVRHIPWHANAPAAAVPQRPAPAAAVPNNVVIASRRPSRVAPWAAPRKHANAPKFANVKPKQAKEVKTNGRGASASSVRNANGSARHVKVAHPRGAGAAHRAKVFRAAPLRKKAKSAPKHVQQSAPPQANPPGHEKQK
jgi:hypothetical protein